MLLTERVLEASGSVNPILSPTARVPRQTAVCRARAWLAQRASAAARAMDTQGSPQPHDPRPVRGVRRRRDSGTLQERKQTWSVPFMRSFHDNSSRIDREK